jgi:hypothetical protein
MSGLTRPQRLDEILASCERVAVIGSPSSTAELALDVLGSAVGRKLIGELALFQFLQDGCSHYALGQITGVELRNIWHEDPTMRSLIRQRGRVDAVSERQDTHLAKMAVSAVFRQADADGFEPSILGTVPPTGTPIAAVNDLVLDRLLQRYRGHLFYLGQVYGSTPRLPLWFKHFDRGPEGAGEAYHLGIFGKTGSGKSVLAKMLLVAYARYREMGVLVIDPQGEFAKDFHGTPAAEGFSLPLQKLVERQRKQSYVFTVRKLVLDRWELFEQVLYESRFFERLTMPKGDNRDIACRVLSEKLRKAKVTLRALADQESFDQAWKILSNEKNQVEWYRQPEARMRFAQRVAETDPQELYEDCWLPVANLFNEQREGARTVDKALRWLLDLQDGRRPVLIVDLSREHGKGLLWTDRIQSLVIKRLLDGLNEAAEAAYKEGQSLNTLVVIDEAHRLAPREFSRDEDETTKGVRRVLVDASRTTRKYGLGWLFISQSLSSLDRHILDQLRIQFFGFGLGIGQEFQALREAVGSSGTALDLYRLFRDPHSSFDIGSRQYSFMTIGPVSPLSFTSSPLFLNVFNSVAAFLHANGLEGLAGDDSEP